MTNCAANLPSCEPADPSRIAALLEQLLSRSVMRQDMDQWARYALAPLQQVPAAHHQLLMRALSDVTDGSCDRLMVLMPPGSAKSTYGSVLFPAWWFNRWPHSSVIATSHTASLASEFGGRVIRLVNEHAPQLGYALAQPHARHNFRTTRGGAYFAAGVHGAITGRRADLVLIDDPVKSRVEAESPSRREHLWNWYRSDLLTRLRPGGRVVLIMTRWHEDDLGGRLLNSGEDWRCVRLPALAEDNDPLARLPGEALWPQWEDRPALDRKRAVIGEREFSALFQQQPRSVGEALFKVSRIQFIDPPLVAGATVRAWDLAATAQTGTRDPDWTVGVKLARDLRGRFAVLDVVRFRGGPAEVENTIEATARMDGASTLVALPQDPGQAGRGQVDYLARNLAGYIVHSSRETGAKATRAMPVASQMEAGNVSFVRGAWNRALLDELRDFPTGSKDDQVDALSRAFAELTTARAPTRQVDLPLFMR